MNLRVVTTFATFSKGTIIDKYLIDIDFKFNELKLIVKLILYTFECFTRSIIQIVI